MNFRVSSWHFFDAGSFDDVKSRPRQLGPTFLEIRARRCDRQVFEEGNGLLKPDVVLRPRVPCLLDAQGPVLSSAGPLNGDI